MTSSIEFDNPVPWVLPPTIEPKNLKNTFRLMWINKFIYFFCKINLNLRNDLFFSNCNHLTNPWNENKEVKIARDGQVY